MATIQIPDLPDNSMVSKAPKKAKPAVSKPEEKQIEKVALSGKVVKKKKTGFARFLERFFGDDIPNVKDYLIDDIAIPAVKNTIDSLICSATGILLFGDAGRRRTSNGGGYYGGRPYTNYGSYYSGGGGQSVASRQNLRPKRPFDDLIFDIRGDADRILQGMFDVLETYGRVSVADLKGLLDISQEFTDNNWGWTNLDGSDIRRVKEGFVLVLPDVVSLRR